MSTFRGIVREFPDIRIDFFRRLPNVRPPLACFLSHVHSDHLAGLDVLKAPFVYCSAATKELLLRLERYPHRMNFAKGILECRKQHYRHLKNLLKPIPLETPTCIELRPGKKIQVTLFDANHCTGAVMFLIEDADNAILYTGDIRSEPWFVNRLARNPFLVEYSSGLKTLDCIYLDTSNAGNFVEFPTKAEGLKELIEKISKYPKNTTFHFAAWTFGYEEVWMTLSRVLNSPIHVDKYKMRLYQSLRGESISNDGKEDISGLALSHEASALAGHKCGNADQPGILTSDQSVKIHSCEKGTKCTAIDGQDIIWIQPIVCRKGGMEVAEVGIGGGGDDLTQKPELEVDDYSINQFLQLFAKVGHKVMDEVEQKLHKALRSSLKSLSLAGTEMELEENELSLNELTKVFIRSITRKGQESNLDENGDGHISSKILPKTITFPYSRHSSHSELCSLLKTFRPADVYPCTVNEGSWHEGVSIKALFGEYCSKSYFCHDSEMLALRRSDIEDEHGDQGADIVDTQVDTQLSRASSEETSMPSPNFAHHHEFSTKLTSLDGTESPEAIRNNSMDQRLHTPRNSELSATATPTSVSQFRRRKAIEDFIASSAKRIRLSSSPSCEESVHSSEDTDEEDYEFSTFYDHQEDVYRCSKCYWEVWMPSGSCEGCRTGEDAYEELILPALKLPEGDVGLSADEDEQGTPINLMHNLMQIGTDSELDPAIMTQLKGKYLDYASSAYTDEEDGSEEYEKNSMIDDASIDSNKSDNESEIDWRAKYEALARQHNLLLERFMHVVDADVFSESSGIMDSEGYEEGNVRIIEVQTQDPDLVELDLDQVDTQLSDLSDELVDLRREALEFLKDADLESDVQHDLARTANHHRVPALEL